MGSFAFEKHYRVRELANLWGLSAKTVARIFADEADVIRVTNYGAPKRKYVTLSIPESAPHAFTSDSATSRSRRRFRLPTHFA